MKINIKESRDAGLALILIFLITDFFLKTIDLILPSIVILVFIMTVPIIFKPFAKVWFTLSHYLGIVTSKIILTLLFFIVITPVALTRRLFKADPLFLNGWNSGLTSAFKKEELCYKKSDIVHPY
ncbi:MAG: hypothetical protein HQK66_08065 [Desulfamplus sp.]|nr:hypothetical protein [Desulfamplus sp.]